MPMKAPYICPSCGKTVPSGERCSCQKEQTKARKARHDRKRPSARQRGYTAEWDKARGEYLAAYPSCAMCGTRATTVDHIKPHKGNQTLFWDRRNWQSLCTSCHSGAKQRQERRIQKDQQT